MHYLIDRHAALDHQKKRYGAKLYGVFQLQNLFLKKRVYSSNKRKVIRIAEGTKSSLQTSA